MYIDYVGNYYQQFKSKWSKRKVLKILKKIKKLIPSNISTDINVRIEETEL